MTSSPHISPASPVPGLLLDRDGVINEECHYLHDPKDLVIIPGVAEAIATVNRLHIPVAVVSNQAGIGRGLYGLDDYEAVTCAIDTFLAERSAHVDGWYFCPHAPEANCACRKPRPGMLLSAASELHLDLRRSVMVGDKAGDLEAARSVSARTVLVRTGYGRDVEAAMTGQAAPLADHVADSLAAALPFLLDVLVGSAGAVGLRSPG